MDARTVDQDGLCGRQRERCREKGTCRQSQIGWSGGKRQRSALVGEIVTRAFTTGIIVSPPRLVGHSLLLNWGARWWICWHFAVELLLPLSVAFGPQIHHSLFYSHHSTQGARNTLVATTGSCKQPWEAVVRQNTQAEGN
jgi:hypothetical protein